MAAAKAFFRSAKTVTGVTPARVTTDGHDSYPRASRTELGEAVRHRTNQYLNNRIEQDHRGIKGRYLPMRGFKDSSSAGRFSRSFDELRNFLRPRSNRNQHVPASQPPAYPLSLPHGDQYPDGRVSLHRGVPARTGPRLTFSPLGPYSWIAGPSPEPRPRRKRVFSLGAFSSPAPI